MRARARARASGGAEHGFAAIGSRRGVRVDARAVQSWNRPSPSDGSRVGRRAATRGDGDADAETETEGEGEGARERDANERFREALREEMRASSSSSSSGIDAVRDDDETAGGGRAYRITVRGEEVLRYTLPDFFPDFNPTPLEARRASGDASDLARTRPKSSSTYVWRRGVLAGTERSDPLDVIARQRDRMEADLADARASNPANAHPDVPGSNPTRRAARDADESVSADGSASRTPPPRRRIPPPPHRVDEDAVDAELGVGSRALLALTLFFYVVSLALTTSRAYFGDTGPAPTPAEEAARRATRSAPPPPESIAGTPAGDAWTEGIERFR